MLQLLYSLVHTYRFVFMLGQRVQRSHHRIHLGYKLNHIRGMFLSVNAHILYFTPHSEGFVSSVVVAAQKDKQFKSFSLKQQWRKMF